MASGLSNNQEFALGTTVGIGIPVTVAVLLYIRFLQISALERRPQRHSQSWDPENVDGDRRDAHGDTTESLETRALKLRPRRVTADAYLKRLKRLSDSELSVWIGFLSIYGTEGVLLRELIMMTTALYLLAGQVLSFLHLSEDGRWDSIILPNSISPFLELLKDASGPRELQALENELSSRSLIIVSGGSQSEYSINQDWVTDTRTWSVDVGKKDTRSDNIDYAQLSRDLLTLYWRFFAGDVHPMAERYRETLYYHGRAAVVYIYRLLQEEKVSLNEMQGLFPPVALKILSFRFQQGDEEIIEVAKGPTISGVEHWPLFSEEYLMLQLIELRLASSRGDIKSVDLAIEPLLRVSANDLPRRHSRLVGYVLTESMDAAKEMRDRKSFDKCAQLARDWCKVKLKSESQTEMAALCCLLVRFKAFDSLDAISQENHLTCGYYLARAGVLRLAVYFLSSGIAYCEQNLPKVPIWRYHIELWSVRMRLGQWEVAEEWLSATWERLVARDSSLPAGGFDLWKQSGDIGEFKLVLASLLSDCYVASSHFVEAEKMILIALEGTLLMRDTFIRSARIALKSRLLNIQSELQSWHNATGTAIDLCDEIQEHETLPIGFLSISWIIQEVMACVDELVHETLYEEANRVLQRLKTRNTLGKPHRSHQKLEQGIDEVHGISLGISNVSTDYVLEDLSAEIDKRCSEILPFLRSTPRQRFNNEVLFRTTDHAPHAAELKHGQEDIGYRFPAPRSMNEDDTIRTSVSSRDKSQVTEESVLRRTRMEKKVPKVTLTQMKKPIGLKMRQATAKRMPQSRSSSRRPPVNVTLEELPEPPRLEPSLQVTSQKAEQKRQVGQLIDCHQE